MHRILNAKVIEKDVEWWKTSLIKSINNATQLEDAIKSSKNFLIEAIPEMEKKGSGWTFHKVLTMSSITLGVCNLILTKQKFPKILLHFSGFPNTTNF